MSTLRSDLAFLLRSLRRSPGYALAVFVTLALGIGAVTALFSAMDQTVFRKPHPHYDRLVVFGYQPPVNGWIGLSWPAQIEPCVEKATSFEAFALDASGRGQVGTGTETLGVEYGDVNPEFFGLLGARAGLGRLFLPGDYQDGAEEVAVLGYEFWKESFGSDPAAIGRTVVMEDRSYRIVGVLSRDFSMPPGFIWSQFFRPRNLVVDPAAPFKGGLTALARLRPGATLAQANAEVAVLGAALNEAPRFKGKRIDVRPLSGLDPRTRFGGTHGAFLGAVAFLYAIACLNAINLVLVRLSGRRRELGVRVALGAPRKALVRLMALESLGLCLLAGLGGLLAAWVMLPSIHDVLAPDPLKVNPVVHLDGRAILCTFGLSVLTAFLVALVPAWRLAGADPQHALKEGDVMGGENPRQGRLREGLVVLSAALALVLLAGTGLMTRSVRNLLKADRGFDPSNKVVFWLDLPKDLAPAQVSWDLAARLEERIQALPGVRGVCTSSTLPLEGVSVTDLEKPDGRLVQVGVNAVSIGYRSALKLHLLKGRWLPEAGTEPIVVLNASMARLWFGDEDPIGRTLVFKEKAWTVIGLVADVRDELRGASLPQFYMPHWLDDGRMRVLSLLVDCSLKPNAALLLQLRQAVHDVEPRAGVRAPMELETVAENQLDKERFTLRILQIISTLALVLAVLGLFGAMAYSVGLRSREFGVRLALGAHPTTLFRAVLRRGLALAGGGVVLGLGGAWGLTRFLRSLLYETSPLDLGVYATMSVVVLTAAALACFLPALRAARTDPATLLKTE